ncbi:feruloyl esterase [Povalibacter uvarum]|uniref:Feruloyl esterase n=1 Tax=Povalibacter uvarum TaxID=732238 RepID=A0A841HSS8_9GAMM|nr:tannase/feruloyl esterase family alpha/beta hydrolase [Povalibacter uvarum]MBB6096451.1 feruloyl esterase [Povalibacter uvarum]
MLLAALLAASVAHAERTPVSAEACGRLGADTESGVAISSSELIVRGAYRASASNVPANSEAAAARSELFRGLPAFCRVTGTIRTSDSSSIRFEVWLPAEQWNGKLLARGYSFYGGPMDPAILAEAIRLGYVTATTDGGGNGERGAHFMLRQPEKLIDVGERAWHSTIAATKVLALSLYGSAPRASYFSGCGGAGRQGLKAAQRYPEDFDGIAVGGIAHDTAHFAFAQTWVWEAAHRSPAHALPAEKLAALNRAVMKMCDSRDGATDGLLQDPRRCEFNPALVECESGDAADCLTTAQVDTARALYAPVINPRTRERIFGPLMPGSELGWTAAISGERPSSYALDFFRYLVFEDPTWDPVKQPLDYDRDLERARRVNETLSAVDPDLTKFVKRGGKLLMFGGWNDIAIPPTANTDYYESVVRKMGASAVANSVRLFMVPGMGHCPGQAFGANATHEFDPLEALIEWREQGKTPPRIVARRFVEGREEREILACPYPQIAVGNECRD